MRWFAVDRGSSMPLIRQIYGEISAQVLNGEMKAGERLPSTRETAAELGVSRNVVMEAYDQLAAEGFLIGISGAGTFVAEGSRLDVPRHAADSASDAEACPARVRGRSDAADARESSGAVDFRLGRPAIDLAPYRTWARLEHEERVGTAPAALAGAPVEGRAELREALRDYLWRRRGVECGPDRIVITSGAVNGLSTLSRAALAPGSEVLFEDPGHVPARESLSQGGARIVSAPVDEEGIIVERLAGVGGPTLAFITPSHQFPIGGCLSIQRRVELVEWARKAGCLIVEDDYESEFRYDVGPVSSIQRLDPENVVYVGTFSKVLFPAIRLGYLVLPDRLVDACLEVRRATDRYCAPAPQLAMARFIREGRLDRHIARMRRIYRERRDALASALEAAFPGRATILGRATGLHVTVAFDGLEFDAGLVEAIRRAGVIVRPVEDFALEKGRWRGCLALGYSHLRVEDIERGVACLRKAVRT